MHAIRANRRVRSIDEQIARLAELQHGVVRRRQLTKLGLERGAIAHRLGCGRLHRIHRGVFAVGHRRLTQEGRWLAAVLAVGPGAALSHRSAGAHWQMLRSSATIEVTSPRELKPRPTIVIHQGPLPPDEVTSLDQIPVTSVSRTLIDLATVLEPRRLERAIEEAGRRRLDDSLGLPDLLSRYPGRRGTAAIREILARGELGATYTRSELEERFLALVRAHSLPSPELNAPLRLTSGDWIEADCLWRAARLIVELDSHGSHGTAAAFERDRARDRATAVAGWRVLRVTGRQIREQPARLATDLNRLLHRE